MVNLKEISETNGFIVMCGIMYFASMVYVYNRHLKIFGYFILVFIFVVSWLFIAKNRNEYLTEFIKTQLHKTLFKTSPYIIFLIYFLTLSSVILNSYGIVTVLKSYSDRIAQVKSYDLNLSQMRRDDLFIFNTGFYISTILLIGLICSSSFVAADETNRLKKINELNELNNLKQINELELSYINYAQMFIFLVVMISSILVAVYSTKFKSVKNDGLPPKSPTSNIKNQTKFSSYSFVSPRKAAKPSSNKGQDLLQSVNQMTPIRLEEINMDNDITIESNQNLVIPEGQTLTVAVNKTLKIDGIISNAGAIQNNGTVRNYGTIINDGTYSGTAPSPMGTILGTTDSANLPNTP